jgi:hypothetical protein
VSVSGCAVRDVAWDVESRGVAKFCFINGCYVYIVVVEEENQLCFFGGDSISVPGYDT